LLAVGNWFLPCCGRGARLGTEDGSSAKLCSSNLAGLDETGVRRSFLRTNSTLLTREWLQTEAILQVSAAVLMMWKRDGETRFTLVLIVIWSQKIYNFFLFYYCFAPTDYNLQAIWSSRNDCGERNHRIVAELRFGTSTIRKLLGE
jgi:hypothetical protein